MERAGLSILYSFYNTFGRVRILLGRRQASGGRLAHGAVGRVRIYTMISLGGREPSPLMQWLCSLGYGSVLSPWAPGFVLGEAVRHVSVPVHVVAHSG